MTAYYNEHDPFAAAWLRNLIAAGLVAPGDVDERDIRDVRPSDLAGYVQCHFFAGIGVWSCALRLAGWPDDRPVWTGSCPCQPFSAAGRRDGFDDERHLWPAWHHLIWQCRPPVVLGEQVASKDAWAWIELVHADMEGTGYAVGAAIAPVAGIGAPHGRHRLWFVADADGRHAGAERQQRSGQYGQQQEDRGARALADAEHRREAARQHGGGSRASAGVGQADERGDGCASLLVGDAIGAGLEVERQQHARRELAAVERASAAGTVADSQRHGWGEGQRAVEERAGFGDDGAVRSLDDTERDGRHARRRDDSAYVGQQLDAAERAGALADDGREGRRQVGAQFRRRGEGGGAEGLGERSAYGSPVHGPWRNAEWLWCRDEKWRPVEPGTFPLAHGVAGRVGKLRAYGNAISPWIAAEFIASYLEARGEHAVTLLDMLE